MHPSLPPSLSASGLQLVSVGLGALTWHLVQLSKSAHPGLDPMSLWRATRLFAGQVRWLGQMRAWHNDASNPALREMLALRPDLVLAAGRPYVNTAWAPQQRLDALQRHYREVQGRLAFLGFAPGSALTIGHVVADDKRLDLVLDKPAWFFHEGEVSMSLFSGEQRLYTLAFLLGRVERRRVAYVGALQGMGDAQALDIYRDLTHALHGLRPRDLLISAFRSLCARVEVEQIYAVSDASSMGRSNYFKHKKVETSYDDAWRDHRGVLADDGFFELSVASARRTTDEIVSRKRALYRRRYAMLDALESEIDTALDGFASAHPPVRARQRALA